MKTPGIGLENYKTLIFDCDGVLLNSNKVKTESFYRAAIPYGESSAQALVNYHIANGGISRYKKFSHFLENIVSEHIEPHTLDVLLNNYAESVKSGLMTCEVVGGLRELRRKTENARWLIVSGGDQAELRQIFSQRGLLDLFDGGIFGSPDIKEDIVRRELERGNIVRPAIFFGDSRYDYKVSLEAQVDFLFMSDWTEIPNWQQWCLENEIESLNSISCLNKFKT
ncbi:HAD family hydrolase [Pseudomonas sp. SGAir0191]|uniref:HAD family hydrolase n=1 Tax=Pseudomonas sp. SGAir0191 TaxID=2217867 RepID=UPI000C2BD3A5|nr:HAD family hydrolase [Pseudomonas sp. SGAir0191]AUA32244.1 HAD family hydrolase [Pseudomonas sp. SGAir0191]